MPSKVTSARLIREVAHLAERRAVVDYDARGTSDRTATAGPHGASGSGRGSQTRREIRLSIVPGAENREHTGRDIPTYTAEPNEPNCSLYLGVRIAGTQYA